MRETVAIKWETKAFGNEYITVCPYCSGDAQWVTLLHPERFDNTITFEKCLWCDKMFLVRKLLTKE